MVGCGLGRRINDLVANIRWCWWRQEVLAPALWPPPGNFGHQRRLSEARVELLAANDRG